MITNEALLKSAHCLAALHIDEIHRLITKDNIPEGEIDFSPIMVYENLIDVDFDGIINKSKNDSIENKDYNSCETVALECLKYYNAVIDEIKAHFGNSVEISEPFLKNKCIKRRNQTPLKNRKQLPTVWCELIFAIKYKANDNLK